MTLSPDEQQELDTLESELNRLMQELGTEFDGVETGVETGVEPNAGAIDHPLNTSSNTSSNTLLGDEATGSGQMRYLVRCTQALPANVEPLSPALLHEFLQLNSGIQLIDQLDVKGESIFAVGMTMETKRFVMQTFDQRVSIEEDGVLAPQGGDNEDNGGGGGNGRGSGGGDNDSVHPPETDSDNPILMRLESLEVLVNTLKPQINQLLGNLQQQVAALRREVEAIN